MKILSAKNLFCFAVLAGALGACTGNEPGFRSTKNQNAAAGLGAGSLAAITRVRHVKVTPALDKVVQLRGSASKDFTYDQLKAVLYCRAWQVAQSTEFSGGYPLRFHKLQGAHENSARVAIASIQLFEGSSPPGKNSIDRSWCDKVPAEAR